MKALVATDGSATSEAALDMARELLSGKQVEATHAPCAVLHAPCAVLVVHPKDGAARGEAQTDLESTITPQG